MSNNGRDRLDDSGEQRRFLFVFESRLQPEPFLRAFTSKAAAGILLLQSVSESDFTRSRRWARLEGFMGKDCSACVDH